MYIVYTISKISENSKFGRKQLKQKANGNLVVHLPAIKIRRNPAIFHKSN